MPTMSLASEPNDAPELQEKKYTQLARLLAAARRNIPGSEEYKLKELEDNRKEKEKEVEKAEKHTEAAAVVLSEKTRDLAVGKAAYKALGAWDELCVQWRGTLVDLGGDAGTLDAVLINMSGLIPTLTSKQLKMVWTATATKPKLMESTGKISELESEVEKAKEAREATALAEQTLRNELDRIIQTLTDMSEQREDVELEDLDGFVTYLRQKKEQRKSMVFPSEGPTRSPGAEGRVNGVELGSKGSAGSRQYVTNALPSVTANAESAVNGSANMTPTAKSRTPVPSIEGPANLEEQAPSSSAARGVAGLRGRERAGPSLRKRRRDNDPSELPVSKRPTVTRRLVVEADSDAPNERDSREPSQELPVLKPLLRPLPGEAYLLPSEKCAVLILPTGDLEDITISGVLTGTTLLPYKGGPNNGRGYPYPKGYRRPDKENGPLRWTKGYREGEALETQRVYPAMLLNDSLTIPLGGEWSLPKRAAYDWLRAYELEKLDLNAVPATQVPGLAAAKQFRDRLVSMEKTGDAAEGDKSKEVQGGDGAEAEVGSDAAVEQTIRVAEK